MAEVSVGIWGLGAIGRRHLSALAHLGGPVDVFVSDPSESAIANASEVFKTSGLQAGSAFREHDGVSPVDVAIIASSARERFDLLQRVLSTGTRSVILEKVLFTSLADYSRAAEKLQDANAEAWVNCARRTYGSFPHLETITSGLPFSYRVEGTGWGLGCNVIHHLDEFAALAGTTEIDVDVSGLEPGAIASKRPGYVEFLGRFRARTANGSTFEAVCHDGEPGDRIVRVEAGAEVAEISQVKGLMALTSATGPRTVPIDIPLQSRITAQHIERILAGQSPNLPDYATADALHRPMIAAFMAHLDRTEPGRYVGVCPIT